MSLPRVAGFVLAGGRSRRMGTDKATLSWAGITLLDHVASVVAEAADTVTVVGRYSSMWPSIPDLVPDYGPVGGISAALAAGKAEWSLIVACDMPGLHSRWLRDLIRCSAGDAVVPRTPDGRIHPLCAVWHHGAATTVSDAVRNGKRRVRDVLTDLRTHYVDLPEAEWHLTNLNTPEDLEAWQPLVYGEGNR